MIFRTVALLVMILPASAADAQTSRRANAAADQIAAAEAEAEAIAASLERRNCPNLGDLEYVAGGRDPALLASAAGREQAGIDQMLATLQQVSQDPGISDSGRDHLIRLASWRLAAAAGRLTLLRIASQAQVDLAIETAAAHPLSPLLLHRNRLQQLQLGGNGAGAVIARVTARLDQCQLALGQAIVAANEISIRNALSSARTPAEARVVGQRFRIEDEGASLPIATAYRQRLRGLIDAEEQRLRVANRPSNRPAPAGLAEPTASPAQVAAATRFVNASNGNNENAALAELSEDIELRTPEGVFRGKAQVREAVRRQAAQGRAGRMATPQVDGMRIYARGQVGFYSVTSSFEFNGANKITRIVVQ